MFACFITILETTTYDTLTEQYLVDQISSAMGPIERDTLITEIMHLFATEPNKL